MWSVCFEAKDFARKGRDLDVADGGHKGEHAPIETQIASLDVFVFLSLSRFHHRRRRGGDGYYFSVERVAAPKRNEAAGRKRFYQPVNRLELRNNHGAGSGIGPELCDTHMKTIITAQKNLLFITSMMLCNQGSNRLFDPLVNILFK